MLGGIIGDIVGSIYEFHNIKSKDFPLWGNGCNITDDSTLAIATADWLLNDASGQSNPAKFYLEYAKQYPAPLGGYGTGFMSWVYKATNGQPAPPYNSCGNGSAMRVGPVGWAFDTEEEVLAAAKVSAECTHNHPEGIKGAQATALAIMMARKGVKKEEIRNVIQNRFGYVLTHTIDYLQRCYSWEGLKGDNGATCQGSVPEAIICALDADSFEDAIRNAVSIGGDSDTIACITGSIAEPLYKIPTDIYEKAFSYLPEEMRKVVNSFEDSHGRGLINEKTNQNSTIMSEIQPTNQEDVQQQEQLTIAEGIKKIVDQRKGLGQYKGQGHLEKIVTCRNFFTQLKEEVQAYESFRLRLIEQENSKTGDYYSSFLEDPTLIDRVKNASAESVLEKLDACISECNRLHARFDRDTINISVIGMARQGKSCLLQSISGLEDSVIPTSSGGDCTGTTSIICNEPGTSKAHAEVIFFNEEEILQTVRKYIEKIGLNCFIGSFDEIPQLRSIVEQYDKGTLAKLSGEGNALFGHLRKYIEHFKDYDSLVRKGKALSVEENDIMKYVAQHENDKKQTPIYNYLAVKEVRVYKEFNYRDAGRIQLVDTIGLGDTSLGIQQKMLDTLRNNSDASFWLKLPAGTGDHWGDAEVKMYDLISDTMGAEMLDKWLYIVLNCSESLKNWPSTEAVLKDIEGSRLHKAGVVVVDCRDKQAVQDKLIICSLQYLANNLSAVDSNLMEKANVLFNDCYKSYDRLYSLAQKIILESPQAKGTIDTFAINKWVAIQGIIQTDFTTLYREYKDKSGIPNAKTKNAITNNCDKIPDYQPLLDWYIKELGKGNALTQVFEDGLKIVRTKISASFDEINQSELQPMQDALKTEIANVLFESALWKNVFSIGETASIEWLNEFSRNKLASFPALQAAIDYILNYKMNISDLLDYEIESRLGIITPDGPQYIPLDLHLARQSGAYDSPQAGAQFISTATANRLGKVKKSIKDADLEITKIPNHSLYARMRRFYEKLLFTATTMDELRDFYLMNVATIWHEEYTQLMKSNQNSSELIKWVDTIKLKNKHNFILNI